VLNVEIEILVDLAYNSGRVFHIKAVGSIDRSRRMEDLKVCIASNLDRELW
jgi:hypothetical protein